MFRDQSSGIVIAGILVLSLFGLAAVLFVSPGPESTQRLALMFGALGTGLAAFVAMLKAGQAAGQTNGKLDARIEAGVHRAMSARRRGDEPLTPEQVDEL